jgi:hypothetical protein
MLLALHTITKKAPILVLQTPLAVLERVSKVFFFVWGGEGGGLR